ncbi:MAG TPA: rod shape-determining protein RodA [Aggregatilineales bacterium]|nr:rod shape-determining protein RodA [Aggregatilineales bacterium]
MNRDSIWRNFDFWMLGVTIVLVVFGILMIRSATTDAVDPDLVNRVPDQIRFFIIGLLVVVGLAAFDYRILGGIQMWLYLFMMAILLAVFFFGVEGDGGARSWLNVGIRIQPAELAKIIIILTLAQFLTQRYQQMRSIKTVIASAIHIGPPTALVFIQPDLGTTIVFGVIWLVLIWAAGLSIRHIVIGVVLLVVAAPLIWSQMQPYQQARITTFIDPASDPDGYYNINQSLIAVGSGGTLGKGYANGTQTQGRFLRVRHTDFIFSVIAEEFGFVGGSVVLVMILFIIMRVLRAARLAADVYGSLICYGIAAIIFFQTFTAVGMNLGVIPVTGLTLPFVSSGGTSLLTLLAGIGIVQSVVMRRRT